MDFTLYPFDRQKCNFIISLIKTSKFQVRCGYFISILYKSPCAAEFPVMVKRPPDTLFQEFQTKINASKILNGNDSIFQAETEMFRFSVHPLDFDIVDGQLSKWSEMKGNYEVKQQHFSVSGFVLDLKRIPTPYLTNIYFPTGLLTIISFIGFMIPVDIIPGRMALLVTIFLMLVNTSSTERNRGPKVNNIEWNLIFFISTSINQF